MRCEEGVIGVYLAPMSDYFNLETESYTFFRDSEAAPADYAEDLDYGLEGEGLVHHCHCANCGAEIIYYIPIGDTDEG